MDNTIRSTHEIAENANRLFRSKEYSRAIDAYRALVLDHDRPMFCGNIQRSIKRWINENTESGSPEWQPSVLFVTAGIKGPTAGGGIATCFFNMITELAKTKKTRVTILYAAHPYYAKGNFEYWSNYFKVHYGVRFLALNTNTKDYGSMEMKRSHAIANFLEEHDGAFDKIVFHDFAGLAFYSALSKRYGLMLQNTNLTISAHGNHELSFYFGSKKVKNWSESAVMFMERSALRLVDNVFTPSQFYANWITEKFKATKIQVQPNIIKIGKIDEEPHQEIKLQLSAEHPAVFFYGRMERLKGLDVFIESIKKLNESGEFFNLIFCGNRTKIDGLDCEEYIKPKITNSQNHVFFVFDTRPTPFFDFVRKNNGLCVYPTLGETSSCVVVESVLESVPFVASDIPGIKELIKPEFHKNFLFETGSVIELGRLISEHFKNKELAANATLMFSMEQNIKEWNSHLSKIDQLAPRETQQKSKEDSELITIIIPTSDRPELLEQTLKSILKQSYENTEIIVIDDYSHEAETNEKICRTLGTRYIKLDEKSYKGKACNTAATYAKGSLICFFDDDDIADPNMLSTYAKALASDPEIDIISCFAGVFEHSNYSTIGKPITEYTSLAIGGNNETNFACNFFGKGTFLIRTEKFLHIGGYEEDSTPAPMVDYRFYIKSALKGMRIAVIPKALYSYRKNSPNSLYYSKIDNKRNLYLAKHGIQKVFTDHFGEEIGRAFIPHIWNIGQPHVE
jgi:glycosyltransferase involved in cell wall biosynthesis